MEGCPNLLDLIPKDREWIMKTDETRTQTEEKKLELRLAPPGEDWSMNLGSYSKNTSKNNNTTNMCSKRVFLETMETETSGDCWVYKPNTSSYLQFSQTHHHNHQHQSMPVMGKESSQPCNTKVVDLQQNSEKKAFSPAAANTAVPNSSQKRSAPAPVVGWPPIRSSRKNFAGGASSKPVSEPQNVVPNKVVSEKAPENCKKGLFVKINMDGVPIGRKVDLKAYDSYGRLSSAVDELFRGLLAAQRDSSAGGNPNSQEQEKEITGLLDGSGEYTLVYEDHEGDRMLVGDVPWHMFVSTVKRLRVLKSSELSSLTLGSSKGRENAT